MERDNKWLLWTMIAIVIIVIGVSWLLIDYYIPDYNVRGQFGDKFGSVNALFSGLAFAGLIYTIILQRKDLQLQKKDLELTRKELEEQKEEAKEQNKTLLKREFNTMYFNFLASNRDIINEMRDKNHVGQTYIKYLNTILTSYRNYSYEDTDQIKKAYLRMYEEQREHLSYYFKSLHNLMFFINNSIEINSTEKTVYFSILMSQLSDYEIVLFFYDNIYRNSDHLIKTLIEHYSLFYKFPDDLLINQLDKSQYNASAYGI